MQRMIDRATSHGPDHASLAACLELADPPACGGGTHMDDVVIARALHVLAVVIWIGGVAMATTVILPAVRRGDLGPDRLGAFHAIEHRFVWQARTAIIVVGLTGFYMVARLDVWARFQSAQFW